MLVVLYATAAQERAGVVGHSLAAVLLAAVAACGFAVFLLAAIRAGDALGDAQLQLIYRVVPFIAIGVPLLVLRAARAGRATRGSTSRPRPRCSSWASCSIAGRAARGGVAIPSVLSSQFAVFAIIGGVLVLGRAAQPPAGRRARGPAGRRRGDRRHAHVSPP